MLLLLFLFVSNRPPRRVNVTSGLSPWHADASASFVYDPAVLACVSCASLSPSSIPLYAFWNDGSCVSNPSAIPATATATLMSMQHVVGGCCMCLPNHDVDSSSVGLCELRAGFTTQVQRAAGSTSLVLSSAAPAAYTSMLGPRRRLQSEQSVVLIIKSHKQPVLAHMDYFAVCDEESTSEGKRDCVATRGVEWELAKHHLQAGDGDGATQACVAGTYKPGRGAGSPCYVCPEGSSTTGPLYEAATSCVCMPGYYYLDSACVACAQGTYRPPNAPDACIPCPPLSESAGSGSTYCYCIAGAYRAASGECVACDAGFYCEADARHQRPQNSVSAAGAKASDECGCASDYYYGQVSGQCIFKGPTRTTAGACAAGWRPTSGGGCSSGCAPGSFFLQGTCVPCPPGTFSSTGDMVDRCMPCPSNKHNGTATCEPDFAKEECGRGQYYDFSACQPCPPGTDSPPNSFGIGSCMCPPGSFVMPEGCQPCLKGTFSHSLGSTCSKCPPGFTTDGVGATALLACRRFT